MTMERHEIDEMFDKLNEKITYYRSVRDGAIMEIKKLMKAYEKLVYEYGR